MQTWRITPIYYQVMKAVNDGSTKYKPQDITDRKTMQKIRITTGPPIYPFQIDIYRSNSHKTLIMTQFCWWFWTRQAARAESSAVSYPSPHLRYIQYQLFGTPAIETLWETQPIKHRQIHKKSQKILVVI